MSALTLNLDGVAPTAGTEAKREEVQRHYADFQHLIEGAPPQIAQMVGLMLEMAHGLGTMERSATHRADLHERLGPTLQVLDEIKQRFGLDGAR